MDYPDYTTEHQKGKHLTYEEYVKIQVRLQDGWTANRIAVKELHCSPNTVRKIIRQGMTPLYHGKVQRFKAKTAWQVHKENRSRCCRTYKAAEKKAFLAAGERTFAYAPLGYIRHPEIKNTLAIDEETRWIIEKIFDLALHGAGAAKITKTLITEKVPTAGWLNYQRYGTFANIYANASEEKSYAWTIAQVKSILQDETYIGNSVHNKQTNISYKNKKKVRKPKEEWIRVENTHEAIISRDVFEQVQKQIASRRRQQKDATTQIFAGLVKCADCGWSMRFGTNRQNKTPYSHFTCSQYGQMGTQCSAHYIRYDTLYVYVLSRIQYWSHRAQLSEEKLLQQILKNGDRERMTAAKRQESELKRAEKRKAEVDGKFILSLIHI